MSKTELNTEIRFELIDYLPINNATLAVEGEGSIIRIDYPNEEDSHITVINERGEQ